MGAAEIGRRADLRHFLPEAGFVRPGCGAGSDNPLLTRWAEIRNGRFAGGAQDKSWSPVTPYMMKTSSDDAAAWRQRYEQEREAREQAERRSGHILAAMSHELRTPLHGVLGMVELLAESPLDSEQREHLATLRSSALALRGLVDELLDHASLEHDLLRVARRPTDVARLIEEARRGLEQLADRDCARLELRGVASLPPRLDVDGLLLRKIVDQLLAFALAAAPRGRATLQVGVARSGHEGVRLRLLVSHDGPALDEDQRADLFAPLARPDDPPPSLFGGLGLGLPIARGLAEAMDGSLELLPADAGNPGETTLVLVLPARAVAGEGVGGA